MPGKIHVTEQKQGTFLRLKCATVHSAWNNADPLPESEDIHINDMATVRLQFEIDTERLFVCRIKATNHANANDIKVKINVSCQDVDVPFYSEWICDDAWKEIGKKLHPNIKFEKVVTNLLDINIHVSKVEEESFIMKLYSDVTFTDFKLSTDQGSVPVHRAFLAAHSDVFQAMLSREWKETTEGRIELNGVTLETLQHLKEYMYLQTLPDNGLEPLIQLASYYLIDSLVTKCASKIALSSKPEDWSRLLEFAAVNKIPELMCAVQMMVNPMMAITSAPNSKTKLT